MSTALVLGGGGLAGIAWEIGLLVGLRDAGVPVEDADVVIGTSAGSVVGTLVAAGVDLSASYEEQTADATGSERAVDVDLDALMAGFAAAMTGTRDRKERRARVGRMAEDASPVPEAERRDIIARRLPTTEWPDRQLLVTAVDTSTGERVVYDRDSDVGLVDAVGASCAVPGVWPPVTIGQHRYMDGGIGSVTNADLAAQADRVLVLAPLRGADHNPLGATLDEEVAELSRHAQVLALSADDESLAAFGPDVLAPASRAPSARAGRRQAATVAEAVRSLWGSR